MEIDSRSPNKNNSNLVFALAHELQQYLETNAARLDPNIYDNLNSLRISIDSKAKVKIGNLSRGGKARV